jgi:hypothetical protein
MLLIILLSLLSVLALVFTVALIRTAKARGALRPNSLRYRLVRAEHRLAHLAQNGAR